jgi:GDPmannose 4,6-dehydratase
MTMGRTALITGITGQDGSYLAKFLLDREYTVYGLSARRTANTLWRLRDLGVETRVRLIDGDLTDLSSIVHAIEKAQPEEVYNLAAQSMVATSWKQPLLTGHVTALGVARRRQ